MHNSIAGLCQAIHRVTLPRKRSPESASAYRATAALRCDVDLVVAELGACVPVSAGRDTDAARARARHNFAPFLALAAVLHLEERVWCDLGIGTASELLAAVRPAGAALASSGGFAEGQTVRVALGAVPDVRLRLTGIRTVALALIRVHHVAARELSAVSVAAVVKNKRGHLVLPGGPALAVLAGGLVANLSRAVHATGALCAVFGAGVAAALVAVVLAEASVVRAMRLEAPSCGAAAGCDIARAGFSVVRACLAAEAGLDLYTAPLLRPTVALLRACGPRPKLLCHAINGASMLVARTLLVEVGA